MLEGDKLACDQLQFGFQAGASTAMCSWTATTVIEHYNNNGSSVYACAMDLSKAFDLVEWVSLFKLLKDKKISPIFLRLLLYVYCRSGLQAMVNICDKFAKLRKLKFSTNVDPVKSKTKCLVFSRKKHDLDKVAPIMLNRDPLPWVTSVKHLGHTLESNNSMKIDCLAKRGKFIGKVNSLIQEFTYVDPTVMTKLLNIYVTSFYGSNLWDLYSSEVTKIYSSWNVTIRNVFNLPWTTHRHLIEPVSCTKHPKTLLSSRMVKFLETLRSSSKGSVRYLANLVFDDRRTLIGRTVTKIANDCNVARSSLTSSDAKNMKYFSTPVEQGWKIPVLLELLTVRERQAMIPGITSDEVNFMITEICTN